MHVVRDGVANREVVADTLVPGDIVIVSEGEKVPADGRIVHDESVRVNEAMLTGESLPIVKTVHVLHGEHAVFAQKNMLFQGSFVVSGRAVMVVTHTGMHTEFGKLAELAVPTSEKGPAQEKIDQLISKLIMAIGGVSIVVLVLALARGIPLAEALRFVMSMAVSAVPEGLPVAITVILVLGMRRLAKYNALARSMKAIENIGIITTIASDKTGTLTKNKLSVQEIWQPAHTPHDVARWLLLASNATEGVSTDPLDTAMQEYSRDRQAVHPEGRTFEKSLPFDQSLTMSGNIWRAGDRYEAAIKGAPEGIIAQCYAADRTRRADAEATLRHFTSLGYRVIALGHIEHISESVASLEAAISSGRMIFVGLIAIADELRPEAAASIKAARAAGITVRMITGDHAETAFAIGTRIGLVEHKNQVVDCRAIADMSDVEFRHAVHDARVFARVVPEVKHRILGVLEESDITAMTGDGVNDVPALTNAHVGIAMGSGADIAKDAGDIVLLDDDFSTIVTAVQGGRVIFDNIRRMMFYLLSTSLGEVMVMIGALIIGLPLPVLAVQILWINLVTDTAFDIPLGLEPAEHDVMGRPPRAAHQPLLDRHMIVRIGIIAFTMAIIALGSFTYFLQRYDLAYAQTIAFTVLVVTQWANAINARSEFASLMTRVRVVSVPFAVGFAVAVIAQVLVLFGPLSQFMHVVPADIGHLAAAAGAGFIGIIIVGELHKWRCRHMGLV